MKSKLLIYALPVIFVCFLLISFDIQDDPINDVAPNYGIEVTPNGNYIPNSDTATPPGFPYPKLWGWVYAGVPNVSGGTVGAIYYNGKYIQNRWNSATWWRFNVDPVTGGYGTIADSNSAYNAGTGAIRDLTIAPDGSGRSYLWGGAAGTALYKLDSMGNRLASYTHTGAAYRAITWDPNRKGFWSANFTGNIVCRDTNGTVLQTIINTAGGKYGLGWDSTDGAAYLYVWSQNFTVPTDTTNDLFRINIGTGATTNTWNFNKGSNIAGGAEVFRKDNQVVLCLNFQNYGVAAYKLRDLTPSGGGSITVTRSTRKSIPDNGGNVNPAVDTINISGIPAGMEIKKMTVTIDSVLHTWIGDLRFWVSKESVTDTLISRPGWTGTGFGNSCDNFIGTRLLDTTGAGIISVQNMTPATCATGLPANSTGNFTPKSPLGVFNDTEPNGNYILRISDNAAADTGSLRRWSVTVVYDIISGVGNNTVIANDYSLSQNYPNPFNPSTTINYSIPKAGIVSLKVYDILGKEVATIVNEFKNAGSHQINYNASALSSGVYFYRISSGNYIDTKKMFLLK